MLVELLKNHGDTSAGNTMEFGKVKALRLIRIGDAKMVDLDAARYRAE